MCVMQSSLNSQYEDLVQLSAKRQHRLVEYKQLHNFNRYSIINRKTIIAYRNLYTLSHTPLCPYLKYSSISHIISLQAMTCVIGQEYLLLDS